MEDQSSERRQDYRYDSNDRLFLQIVDATNPDIIGTTVSCTALDVSAGGLRIETASKIPEGCRLDIWVGLSNGPGKFFLTSEVKWSKVLDSGMYQIGVELNEGSTTDISEWRQAH